MSDVSYQEFVIEGAATIIEGVGWAVPEGATYNEIVILAAAAIITSGGVSDSGIAALILNEASVTRQALNGTFVAVRTSDGFTLPPDTIVVITIDKTLAEVTATPIADIADITFEVV